MIAAGRMTDAQSAAEELRSACMAAGIRFPGIAVDPHVWDSTERGPERLVELGSVRPELAQSLAVAIRRGVER